VRIEWLNADMTSARLTRGRLWWKRVAEVRRMTDKEIGANWMIERWRYVPSERAVSDGIRWDLETARTSAIALAKAYEDWHAPAKLPRAVGFNALDRGKV